MKSSNTRPALSDNFQEVHENFSEALSAEDLVVKTIDSLEVKIYRSFADVERRLDDYERRAIATVKQTFGEMRVTNIENMEAAQIDLECLRQRVMGHGFELCPEDPTNFLNELTPASVIQSEFALGGGELGEFLASKVRISYRLPTVFLNLHTPEHPSSFGECLLFDAENQKNSTTQELSIPLEEVLQGRETSMGTGEASPRESIRSKVSLRSRRDSRYADPAKSKKPALSTPSRFLLSSVCALTVGAVVHFTLSRLGGR